MTDIDRMAEANRAHHLSEEFDSFLLLESATRSDVLKELTFVNELQDQVSVVQSISGGPRAITEGTTYISARFSQIS